MMKRIAEELPSYFEKNLERIESEKHSILCRKSSLPNLDRKRSEKKLDRIKS